MKYKWLKDVEGFEDYKGYLVCDNGNIISFKRKGYIKEKYEHNLKPLKNSKGYLQVGLSNDNSNTRIFLVHRLIAFCFIPNPKKLSVINHKDENKTNNDVNNLEWCTNEYNLKYSNVTYRKCEQNYNSKITKQDVEEIRHLYKTGKFTQQQLSDKYNISRPHISDIINNKKWIYYQANKI